MCGIFTQTLRVHQHLQDLNLGGSTVPDFRSKLKDGGKRVSAMVLDIGWCAHLDSLQNCTRRLELLIPVYVFTFILAKVEKVTEKLFTRKKKVLKS